MEFKLRPWKMSDAATLPQQANNFKIARYLTNGFPHPYTEENAKNFIAMATTAPNILFLAIEIDGQAAGGIGISRKTDIWCKNAELGYWLSEKYWGQGIVTEAIGRIVEMAFQQYDISRIYATPFGSNKASQRVLEKAGFTLEARLKKTLFKNNEYEDELIYAIHR